MPGADASSALAGRRSMGAPAAGCGCDIGGSPDRDWPCSAGRSAPVTMVLPSGVAGAAARAAGSALGRQFRPSRPAGADMPAEGVPPVSEQGPSLAAVTADTAVPSLAPVPPGGRGRPGGCSAPGGASRGLSWPELEGLVRLQAASLSAPPAGRAGLTGGGSDARGRCLVCRGPSDGRARCFQCELHEQCAAGSLADVVVPVAYAVKGGSHARRLWQYKSPGPAAAAAAV